MSPTVIPLALVGAFLAASAVAKLWAPRRSAAALSWVVPYARWRVPALSGLILLESGLAAAVGLAVAGQIPVLPVALAAAAFLLGAAALLARAVLAGRGGQPCGCLGARGTIGWLAAARAGGAGVLALLALVPADPAAWLGVGVALALLACGALAAVSLALAREIGELRIGLAGDVALEIADEGPEIGVSAPGWPSSAFADHPRSGSALEIAVFTSEGCAMCARIAPAVEHLARDPNIALARFDEIADGPTWAALGVPGSPYAIVAGQDATVWAKGTFNSLAQLESIVATSERRRSGAAAIESGHA